MRAFAVSPILSNATGPAELLDQDVEAAGHDLALPFEVLAREECLGARADLLLQAAIQLMTLPIDDAIRATLEALGAQWQADRAWMFEYDARGLQIHNTHEWTKGGITPHVEDLQGMSVSMMGWLHRSLVEGRAVMINDVNRMPRVARRLQVEMQRQHDLSVLSVPVFHGGMLRACIGFDATSSHRRWGRDTIATLFHCAELIGAARYRNGTPGGKPQQPILAQPAPAPIIHLQVRNGTRGVAVDSILGVRSSRDYTDVWLTDGSVVVDHRPIRVWFGMLPKAFLRVHRTAALNLPHVERLDRKAGSGGSSWNVYLRGVAKPWAVSRPYRQSLRTKLGV